MFQSSPLSKRAIGFAFLAALCFALVATLSTAAPAAAAPSNLTAASTASTGSAVSAASSAKMKTVYVLVKQVDKSTFGSHTDTRTTTITYTADGLIKKNTIVSKSPNGPKATTVDTFYYGNKYQLKKEIEKFNGKVLGTTTYKCDKKGRVTKSTFKTESGSHPRGTYKYNSKGQLTKSTGMVAETTYKYNSAGRVKSAKEKSYEFNDTITHTYKYDKNGFLSQIDSDTKCKNTVKSGRLVKRVKTSANGDKTVTTFTYKKMKVPTAAVKMVKSQQELMIQGIQSFRVAHR